MGNTNRELIARLERAARGLKVFDSLGSLAGIVPWPDRDSTEGPEQSNKAQDARAHLIPYLNTVSTGQASPAIIANFDEIVIQALRSPQEMGQATPLLTDDMGGS